MVPVNMISKLAPLSMAWMSGSPHFGLQGVKEAPKDKRANSVLSTLRHWGKALQERVADLDGRPRNLHLQLCFVCISGKKIGRFRINYYCE